ncbi:MAG: 23S rRNA (guanosine2251-2'-O)-methyltransferase [Parasphingorhabdus sp.]|jgi:23S rRNA (guanosine2251-2'-O)-methyltransferase
MKDTLLIAGIRDVQSALEHNSDSVQEVWVSFKRRDNKVDLIVKRAEKLKIPVSRVSPDELDVKVDGVRHQGVVARCIKKASTQQSLESLLSNLQHPAFILVLDGIQDPHNLGACMRSADAAGVDAIIAPEDKSCPVTPVVSKVAAGAAHSVPYFTVTNLNRCLEQLQQQGIWVVGTSDSAKNSLWRQDLTGPIALVVGAEGDGMRQLTMKRCDHLVQIPMQGVVESLNVSVATGVLLFEALRQRA